MLLSEQSLKTIQNINQLHNKLNLMQKNSCSHQPNLFSDLFILKGYCYVGTANKLANFKNQYLQVSHFKLVQLLIEINILY